MRSVIRPVLFYLSFFLLLGGTGPAGAASVAPPDAAIHRDSGTGAVHVTLSGAVDDDLRGYNVYREGRYFTTVSPGSASSFRFEGAGGRYCVVAFAAREGRTHYSVCSEEHEVADGRPAPPSRLRATVYSPGVADIVWTTSPDHVAIAGYELSRDGERVAFTKGRSLFESSLATDRLHEYEIVAVDRAGRRSVAVRYRLDASFGANLPQATARLSLRSSNASSITSTTSSPTPPPAGAPPELSDARVTLLEGSDGVRVTVRVPALGADERATFSVEGVNGDELDGLEHGFEPAVLAGGGSETTLRLKLPIAMGPRLPHTRVLRVRVERDGLVAETRLPVDVRPTAAHDVYLLIGQSNMEGTSEHGSKRAGPGEADEPDPRIRQLHVTRNSRTAFPELADFTRESRNWHAEEYIVAEDPLHDDRSSRVPGKSGDYVGLGLTFAKAALRRTTTKVYLVPAAWGATGFCANANGDIAWNATPYAGPGLGGTLLLERALLRLGKTLRDTGGILRGILWHQGGADANDSRCAASYADNLQKMVRRFRREAQTDPRGPAARGDDAPIPFIVATQSKGNDERGNYGAFGASKRLVDAAHRGVSDLLPYADHVNNDDLVPPAYPCGRSSCVHFGAAALREQGERFDQALRRILERD